MAGLHPPKIEIFDTAASINTDPKGFPRAVDRWETLSPTNPGVCNTTGVHASTALYMARPADHPRFGYLESWLLPTLDLRVNRFHFRNGTGHGPYPRQELYIDICRIEPPDSPDLRIWRTTDLYIDIVTYAGGRWEVLDLEELGEALLAGFLEADTVNRALAAAQRVITGLVTTGSAPQFLKEQGYDLHWADPGTVTPLPAES